MQPIEPAPSFEFDRRFQLWLEQLRQSVNGSISGGSGSLDNIVATFPGEPIIWIMADGKLFTAVE